jgi:hypothetical protein
MFLHSFLLPITFVPCRQLLAAVLELYAEGLAQEMQGMLASGVSEVAGDAVPDADVLLETLFHHFQKTQRLAQAVEYFRVVKLYHLGAAVQVARALMALGMVEDALVELKEAAKGERTILRYPLDIVYVRSFLRSVGVRCVHVVHLVHVVRFAFCQCFSSGWSLISQASVGRCTKAFGAAR